MSDDALIIGRFQPLHRGHEDLIEYAREQYDTVTILTAEGKDHPSDRNPLSLEERHDLIDEIYGEVKDIHRSQIPDDNEGISRGVGTVIESLERYYDDPTNLACITENEETIDSLEDTYDIDIPPENKFRESPYRGGHVREQAATGGDWQDGVSDDVAAYLEDIGFEERMADLWER